MLKISEEHAEVFKALEARDFAIQNIIQRATREAQVLQLELQTEAKAHWAEVMAAHGIEGNWRYENGKLFPVVDSASQLAAANQEPLSAV